MHDPPPHWDEKDHPFLLWDEKIILSSGGQWKMDEGGSIQSQSRERGRCRARPRDTDIDEICR
jgi:hypothetical protein